MTKFGGMEMRRQAARTEPRRSRCGRWRWAAVPALALVLAACGRGGDAVEATGTLEMTELDAA
ncbi:MAG TPA: hypothetical protein VF541_12195, partial [Longimicrobium sp.]